MKRNGIHCFHPKAERKIKSFAMSHQTSASVVEYTRLFLASHFPPCIALHQQYPKGPWKRWLNLPNIEQYWNSQPHLLLLLRRNHHRQIYQRNFNYETDFIKLLSSVFRNPWMANIWSKRHSFEVVLEYVMQTYIVHIVHTIYRAWFEFIRPTSACSHSSTRIH